MPSPKQIAAAVRKVTTDSLFDPSNFAPNPLFVEDVLAELSRARAKFGPQRGPHESYAVVLEEMDEWWDEIKRNNRALGLKELTQVAAMCVRAAEDVYGRVHP